MFKQGEVRRWQQRGRRNGGDAAASNGGRPSIGATRETDGALFDDQAQASGTVEMPA
jgi:transposase